MKERTKHSLQVFSILTVFLLLFVFNATHASAEFYVIAGSRGVGTEIKSLPYTISSSGFYYITKDLSCATGTHGITITADNVTLDLMGFSLVGPAGTGIYDGIYMNGKTNVEIRNGTVRNFLRRGIYEINNSTGTGHRIVNIRAWDNGSTGIHLYGQSHIVESCTAVGNDDHGIYADYSSTVTGNTCYKNEGHGIYANIGSTVTGNTSYSNGGYGIITSSGSTIIGNTCYMNDDHGIYAYYGSTVTGNNCYDNGDDGTGDGIYACTGATVIGNTCRNNTNYGIYLVGNNFVDQNSATNNGTDMNSCSTCTVGLNHVTLP